MWMGWNLQQHSTTQHSSHGPSEPPETEIETYAAWQMAVVPVEVEILLQAHAGTYCTVGHM
jgi:hypothetical protein